MATTAEALHREAVELGNRADWDRADRLLARARARTDDPGLRARIDGTAAVGLAHRGAMADAEALCAEALRRDGLDATTLGFLAGQMGTVMERAGRLGDAHRWLSKGIAAIDEPIARAHLLMNRGLIGIQRGRLDAAAADTQQAVEAYLAGGREVDAAEARSNLGYIDLLRGDLVSAMREMRATHGVIAASSALVGAVTDVDRAEVLRDAGLTRDAEELLERAAAVFGTNRAPRLRAEAEFTLARSLLTHDAVRAERVARASARRFDALGNAFWAARAHALRLRAHLSARAAVDVRRGVVERPSRVRSTREGVDAAAAALDRLGLRNDSAALRMTRELAVVRDGDGRGARAVRVPARASLEVRLLAQELRAARSAARGRGGDARRHAAEGLELLTGWQGDFGSLDLLSSAAMHGSGLLQAGLTAAVRSGRADVLFEWSERARHLGQQVVPVRPPPDPVLADELAELRRLRADDPAWADSPRVAELRERARERQWSRTRAGVFQRRIALDELVGAVDADTAVLCYVYSGARLHAVVVTRGGARVVELAAWSDVRTALAGLRADLDVAASVTAGALAGVVRASLDARLAALSRLLVVRALAAAPGCRRIVLTVPGVLSGVPWSMLPPLRGMPLVLAASATRWAHAVAAPAPRPRAAGFAVGPRVPRGEEEVRRAAAAWRGPDVALAATTADVVRLAAATDVLHVASHGRHAADNPMFSGLELADGTLFGYDVDLVPALPDTVVLSACEVGRSAVRWGEEAVGMTRVWLHAGTRCVIAAPVVVADDAACELLGAMHESLAAGAPPAIALAGAAERTGIVAPFQAHGAGF